MDGEGTLSSLLLKGLLAILFKGASITGRSDIYSSRGKGELVIDPELTDK